VTIERGAVTNLLSTSGIVHGVEFRRKATESETKDNNNNNGVEETEENVGGTEKLEADFVVNCSGRRSRVDAWLKVKQYYSLSCHSSKLLLRFNFIVNVAS
jgi:flavin-dependent dehydrogenase